MTEKARKGQLLDSGLNTKTCILENPCTNELKCEYEDVSDGIEDF